MKDRKDFSKGLLKQFLISIFKPDAPGATDNRGLLAALGLLAFVGEEAVQVLFRKNFGKDALDPQRILGCFILFELLAGIFFFVEGSPDSTDKIGSHESSVWGGIFYFLLGLVVLIKGMRGIEKAKGSKKPYKYAGDSAVLGFLKSERGEPEIQRVWEPVFVLAIGIFFSFINILWGFPIIYCGLSVWACLILDEIFLEPSDSQSSGQPPQGRRPSNTK